MVATFKASELLEKIAKATWQCGDPGMQFDTTVNRWHTSKNTARINASNPCSEYMFLDDSACNLASLNLMKFAPNGVFDIDAYRYAVDILITAQEILVDNAGYPTEAITKNSHDYRPLGLGYANLGALLMAAGLPYDSEAGRDYAACVTAIMCGEAYLQSSRIAESCPTLAPATDLVAHDSRLATDDSRGGACPGFYINREPFLDVIRMHRASVNSIGSSFGSTGAAPAGFTSMLRSLIDASKDCWDEALSHGEKFGYRNSQVTVLAPTGTIGFMMDCDTTGIEPDLALVKYKKLVGGGMIKIVNQTVPTALFKLGYSSDQANAIVSYIDATGTIEGAPHVKDEHLPVFDCSFKPAKGNRSIHYMGHLRMMSAAQPFISGAISKTINMPENASVEEIADAYIQAWKLGLKAVAIYRDGCKKAQPLSAAGTATASSSKDDVGRAPSPAAVREAEDLNAPPRATRHKLPEERFSVTHKFNIAGHEGYITVGVYPNGQPGEIFITQAKEGSTVSGLMDSFALAVSIALQHGVPLKLLVRQIQAHPLRAPGLVHARRDRLRQLHHGLHLPLAGDALPHRPAAIAVRRPAAEGGSCSGRKGFADDRRTKADDERPPANHGQRSPGRQAERDCRPRRRPDLLDLRLDHDAERKLLSLHELRIDQWVQLRFVWGGRPFDFAQGRLSPAALFGRARSYSCRR